MPIAPFGLFDSGPAWLILIALAALAVCLRYTAISRRDRREERSRARRVRAYARAAEFHLPPTTDRRAPQVRAAAPSRRPAEARRV